MTIRTKVAFFLYLAVVALLAVRGVQMVTYAEFFPYQSEVVGMPWSEVPANFQFLISFLNKYGGGTLIVFCLCILTLLLVPYRQGASWALYAVPGLLLAYCAASVNSMIQIVLKTEAQPPIAIVGALAVIVVVAFIISVSGAKKLGV